MSTFALALAASLCAQTPGDASTPPATPTERAAEASPAPAVPAAPAEDAPPRRSALDSLTVDYEVGGLFIFQNDGRYGANGTDYSASDVGQQRNLAVAQRLALEAQFGRHTLIALWAPLDLTTRVTLGKDVVFRDATLAAGAVFDHRYLFDGYRLSYLFRALQARGFSLGVGASFQVRNASVEFRSVDASPAQFVVERDIGLVFAVKGRVRYDAGPLYAMLDADFINTFGLGLAGGLHDVALTLGVPVVQGADLVLRLRLVGGGANVPNRDIYNWGNFGAALLGLRIDLPALWESRRRR
ncbi:MAG: hypothetical protein INH41_07480 [Myxococcaceae bacterium]|jgi:hypothetical protein|nr:hypothetical protein [Myxococcaceae bacterium]